MPKGKKEKTEEVVGCYLLLYEDKAKRWRFRLRAGNHKNIMSSGESFHSRANAYRAAMAIAGLVSSGAHLPILMDDDTGRSILS